MSDPDSLDALIAAARARAFSRDGTAEDLARLRELEARRAASADSAAGQRAGQGIASGAEASAEARAEARAEAGSAVSTALETAPGVTESRATPTGEVAADPSVEATREPEPRHLRRIHLSRPVALLAAAAILVGGFALGATASTLGAATARDARLAGFPSFSGQETGEVGAAMRVFDRVPAPGEMDGLDPAVPLSRLDSADTRVLAVLNLGTVYGIRGYLGNRPGVCLVVVPDAGDATGDCTFLGDFLTDGIALDLDGASIRWESTDTRVWVAQSFAVED